MHLGLKLGLAARRRGGGAALPYSPAFPRTISEYGMVNYPTPRNMTSQQANVTEWGRFEIPAGVGNQYRATAFQDIPVNDPGGVLLVYLEMDATSGAYDPPVVFLNGPTISGANRPMVEESPGIWVLEFNIPAAGLWVVNPTVVSADASNPVTGTLAHVAVKPSDGDVSERVAAANWPLWNYADAAGNIWPTNKQTLSVPINTTTDFRAFGVTVSSTEEVLILAYLETTAGGPAVVDRIYMQVRDGSGTQSLVYLNPVAENPGLYAVQATFDDLTGGSILADFYVDNGSTFVTEEAVEVKNVAMFKNPAPASFSAPSTAFSASDGTFVEQYADGIDVFVPMFSGTGNEYLMWKNYEYDTTGNAKGGGVGSVLQDLYYCYRKNSSDFEAFYKMTDAGLNEFALKKSDASSTFVGHDFHGGQARRAAPSFKIDDVAQTLGVRANFVCNKVEWIEYSEVYDHLDGTTVIANLDTTKTWDNGVFKIKQDLTFQANIDIEVAYMFMLSCANYLDENVNNQQVFNQLLMPDQGNTSYPASASGVNGTYPDETNFVANGALGYSFDVAVQGTPPATYRSWIQAETGTRKFYLAPLGVHDSFGLVAERVPLAVTTGQTVSLETWVTVTT
jgi:hypothetical protein